MLTGLVFNIQRYSVHDGPGIRTTVFLKGCPLCCSWCHNPESMSPRREIAVNQDRCAACGECRQACPLAEAASGVGPLPVRNEACALCEACADACPAGARQIVGREMAVQDVLREILRDRVFFDESSGGATFSGGEPLLQPRFVLALLEACRARGVHAALDTCGFGRAEHLLAMARLAPLVLYDLKLMDDARHRRHCGVSNTIILENLRALDRVHGQVWIRVPLVPGVNDDEANLQAIGRLAAGLASVRQVNLLPYHRTGAHKFQRLGLSAPLEGVPLPESRSLERAAALLRAAGLNVRLGG